MIYILMTDNKNNLCYKLGASETHDASNMDSEHMFTAEHMEQIGGNQK